MLVVVQIALGVGFRVLAPVSPVGNGLVGMMTDEIDFILLILAKTPGSPSRHLSIGVNWGRTMITNYNNRKIGLKQSLKSS